MDFMETSNGALHYEYLPCSNAKRTLVFVNSLGTDYRIWDTPVGSLQSEYSIVRYDKRMHGLSSHCHRPYPMEEHVKDLKELLQGLRIEKAIICGLSVGGMIAQGLAFSDPEQVDALILCDTGHKIGTRELWQDRIKQVEAEGLSSMTDAVMERWFTKEFRKSSNPLYSGCRAMFERQDPMGYSATCAAIRDADYSEARALIKVPTLCVVGDHDLATPAALVRELADGIPESEFALIENAGHIPCVEAPETFTDLLTEFLTRRLS
ncbi:3-oxoadipate enol-lactonase [Sneathiella aquimaris]|uniref:3-oxoadipate enol-lactonase n=1 Tax=Sneathiella aquimaris TaxID=2599305 RepID=UPI00146AD273|nr:3-oxoadipate enol-lactonase [Sneathiella aquimaris]